MISFQNRFAAFASALIYVAGFWSLYIATGAAQEVTIHDSFVFNDTTEFLLLLERTNFETAKANCESLGGTVARIDSEEIFDAVVSFLIDAVNAGLDSNIFYIGETLEMNCKLNHNSLGLEDVTEEGSAGRDPTRFTFVDASQDNLDFFATAGKFPWRSNEPQNSGDRCVL